MEVFTQLLLALLALAVVAQGQHDLTSQSEHDPRRVARGDDGIYWNDVIDNLISQFRQQLFEQGKDMVRLPDIKERIPKKILFTIWKKFDASGGHVKSVTSVHRVGDATLSNATTPPTLTVMLKFGDLRIHYQHYHARIGGVGPRGKIDATVADNMFRVTAKVNEDDHACNLDFVDAQMLELKGFKVTVKGLGPLNWLASIIASHITEKMRVSIAANLEEMLNTELRDIFSHAVLDCSQFQAVGGIDIRGGRT